MKVTAFVSHEDCPRHDTGWNHPDHQGRLPAIARAVYRDMLTLFDPLLELAAVPARPEDLTLVHDPAYLGRIRERSERAGREAAVLELDGVPVSGATWEAVLAAVGGAFTGTDAVMCGEVRNAFVLARPPGRDALRARGGRFSLVNTVALAARRLRLQGTGRVLVLAWGAEPPDALAACLAGDPGITLASAHRAPFGEALGDALERGSTEVVLLSAGFEILAGDPMGGMGVEPDDVYPLTVRLREWAEANAGGRLVSVLEGGFDARATARAVVQHLRALAGLPPA